MVIQCYSVEVKMANDKVFTLTKAYLAKVKASDAKMSNAQKRSVSKALVEANTSANVPRKPKKA